MDIEGRARSRPAPTVESVATTPSSAVLNLSWCLALLHVEGPWGRVARHVPLSGLTCREHHKEPLHVPYVSHSQK